MRLQCRLFVTTQGCSNATVARDLVFELALPLDDLYERGIIAGYQAFALYCEDDYEEHDLDRAMIEQATGGSFPAIFLNITYRIDRSPPDVLVIEPTIAKYGFQHMLTEQDPEWRA